MQWAVAALFWCAIAALYGVQIWLIAQQPGERLNVYRIVVWQMPFYLAWIPATVVLWRAVERWPPDHLGVAVFAGWHIVGCLAVTVVHATVVSAVGFALSGPMNEPFSQSVVAQTRSRIYIELIIYTGVVAAGYASTMYGRWREQADRAARLEGELAEATLSTLRAQLHPHLLFNSLHAVAALVRESRNAEAVRLIADIGDLLRRVLETGKAWHALDDELALVRTYVDVQRARFEDRLQVAFDIADDTRPIPVPVLVLQPLVENSLRHGFATKVDTGHLTITARRSGQMLVLQVVDDGVGVAAAPDVPGTGLANLRARLATMYGAHASVDAGPGTSSGYAVAVRMPWPT